MGRGLGRGAAMVAVAGLCAGAAGPAGLGAADLPGAGYVAEIEKWRRAREASLTSDAGWLAVAGLFWLKEGPNTFGSGKRNDIVLPASAPASAGVFHFTKGRTTVRVESSTTVLLDGQPVAERALRADTDSGGADVLVMGALSLQVIERGGHYGIRLRDTESPRRRAFQGLRWYPVREANRVTARYVPHPGPHAIPIANVLGQVEQQPSPGYVVFSMGGREVRLEPVLEHPDAKQLFFLFKDQTAGRETYPAGRFLYTDLPAEGSVVLDFNKAYSPPCAFTPYATCPLPPRQNRLPIRIEAGEKRPPGLH